MNSRRHFLMKLAVAAPVVMGSTLRAQTTPPPAEKLDEKDPVAIALGYIKDTTKVDQTKYPMHKVDQKCSNCALVTPGSAEGEYIPCTAFQNKLVASNGWCAAWAKKPDAAPAPAPTPKP